MARRITSYALYSAMILLVIALLAFNIRVSGTAFKMDDLLLFETWFFNFFIMGIFLFGAITGFINIAKYGNNRSGLFTAAALPFAFYMAFKAVIAFVLNITEDVHDTGGIVLFVIMIVAFIGLLIGSSIKTKNEIVKVAVVEVFMLIFLITFFIRIGKEDTFSAVMIVICTFLYMAQVPFLMKNFDIPGAPENRPRKNRNDGQFSQTPVGGQVNNMGSTSIYDEIPRHDSGAITFDIPRSEEEDKED